MDQRDFLKLGGAGLAVIALLGTIGLHSVLAEEGSSLEEEFEEAAEKYRVPKELLLAIGYVNTHWEMPPPQASNYEEGEVDGKGTYGIMATAGFSRRWPASGVESYTPTRSSRR